MRRIPFKYFPLLFVRWLYFSWQWKEVAPWDIGIAASIRKQKRTPEQEKKIMDHATELLVEINEQHEGDKAT